MTRSSVCRLVFVAVLLIPRLAHGCLWDSDTLRRELTGLPGITEIITGRFERPPAPYFEMRLARAAAAVAANADDLDAIDDAAVACERLGRGDEAIAWMARKKEALDRLSGGAPAAGDHLYRYYANLGTFLAHRWMRKGADRADMADIIAGREMIARAIEINPDAHFGRERYQLLAIDWLIQPPPMIYEVPTIFEASPLVTEEVRDRLQHPMSRSSLAAIGFGDAVEGLSGLITLGSGWESVDVFYALAIALDDRGDASAAYLARLRCEELLNSGARSAHPAGMSEAALQYVGATVFDDQKAQINHYFREARVDADNWVRDRNAFMLTRLRKGSHPDTDQAFWSGYQETPPPEPPNGMLGLIGFERTMAVGSVVVAMIVAAMVTGVVMVFRRIRARRRRRAAAGTGT